MTPRQIVEAFINSPITLQMIIDSIKGDNKHLEHYWALSIENEQISINYEYFGHDTHIPNKFIDKKFIPLHSHVGIDVSPDVIKSLKYDLSRWIRDEVNIKENRLHGSSYPSKEDLICFIWDKHEVFGVCSLYNGYVKISFYNPTSLSDKELESALKEIFEWDAKLTNMIGKDISPEKALDMVKDQLNLWRDNENLNLLCSEPHSSHLIIPL